MARLEKEELKSIIKECLIEILAEGLGPKTSKTRSGRYQSMNEAFKGNRKKRQTRQNLSRRSSHLDNIRMGASKNLKKPVRQEASVRQEAMSKITSDPLMQDILSDTASTTLVAQGTGSSQKSHIQTTAPADAAAQIVSENDPTELFAESAQNWATLAFS